MKGKIYAANGDTEKAISSLQTAIEVNPSFFDGSFPWAFSSLNWGTPLQRSSTGRPLSFDHYPWKPTTI